MSLTSSLSPCRLLLIAVGAIQLTGAQAADEMTDADRRCNALPECQGLSAACLACRKKTTVAQICAMDGLAFIKGCEQVQEPQSRAGADFLPTSPLDQVNDRCCNQEHADCLACQRGISANQLCTMDFFKDMDGCPGASRASRAAKAQAQQPVIQAAEQSQQQQPLPLFVVPAPGTEDQYTNVPIQGGNFGYAPRPLFNQQQFGQTPQQFNQPQQQQLFHMPPQQQNQPQQYLNQQQQQQFQQQQFGQQQFGQQQFGQQQQQFQQQQFGQQQFGQQQFGQQQQLFQQQQQQLQQLIQPQQQQFIQPQQRFGQQQFGQPQQRFGQQQQQSTPPQQQFGQQRFGQQQQGFGQTKPSYMPFRQSSGGNWAPINRGPQLWRATVNETDDQEVVFIIPHRAEEADAQVDENDSGSVAAEDSDSEDQEPEAERKLPVQNANCCTTADVECLACRKGISVDELCKLAFFSSLEGC